MRTRQVNVGQNHTHTEVNTSESFFFIKPVDLFGCVLGHSTAREYLYFATGRSRMVSRANLFLKTAAVVVGRAAGGGSAPRVSSLVLPGRDGVDH